jgi:hypothetical protein
MTLSDAGLYFKMFCWAVGFMLVARFALPALVAEWRERKRERESEEFDAYLESIDPDYERFVHGNGTKVPLRDVEEGRIIDPWKRY